MGVAQKHELYRYVRFNSEVDSSAWDETDKKWKTRIQIAGGKESEYQRDYTISSDFLVSAVGQLNSPNIPQFSGLEQYQGRIMHSARWDWSTPIQDRRVCVIGTGELKDFLSLSMVFESFAMIEFLKSGPVALRISQAGSLVVGFTAIHHESCSANDVA